MRLNKFLAIFFLMTSTVPSTALLAHPTAYKGAFVFDNANSANESDLSLHYSLHPRLSVGIHGMRLTGSSHHSGEQHYSVTSYTGLLLKRWNHEKFQANIYVYGGVGSTHIRKYNELTFFAGSQADIEDRQWLLMGKFETMQIRYFEDHYTYTGRLGFAPYQGEFGDFHTWFIGQYDFKPDETHEHDFSPMVRFFYKNILVEAGSSFRGNWKLNLMFHY